jgi:hypothetical protein
MFATDCSTVAQKKQKFRSEFVERIIAAEIGPFVKVERFSKRYAPKP